MVLVQIAGMGEKSPTNKDALSIEQDRIPDGGRSGFLEPESGEVELPLANAVHQLDARKGGCRAPETFEAEHRVRSGLDVAMVLVG